MGIKRGQEQVPVDFQTRLLSGAAFVSLLFVGLLGIAALLVQGTVVGATMAAVGVAFVLYGVGCPLFGRRGPRWLDVLWEQTWGRLPGLKRDEDDKER